MNAAPADFWQQLPLGRGVGVLTHDPNGLAALGKPAGVLSHPNTPGADPRALLTANYVATGEYFEWTAGEGGEARRLWLLNRLDSATSGVILVADSAGLAAAIRAHFKRKQVRKVYLALVFGAPRQPLELWRDRLAIAKHGGTIRTAAVAGHVPAESRMSVLRAGRREPRLSLLRLEPKTGRSHQLRVQCAKRQLPIVGDQTYGDFRRNREFAKATGVKRLFLHSAETSFEYEWEGGAHRFSAAAAIPAEFEELL